LPKCSDNKSAASLAEDKTAGRNDNLTVKEAKQYIEDVLAFRDIDIATGVAPT